MIAKEMPPAQMFAYSHGSMSGVHSVSLRNTTPSQAPPAALSAQADHPPHRGQVAAQTN